MRFINSVSSALALLACSASAFQGNMTQMMHDELYSSHLAAISNSSAMPLPPSKDPWYTAPAGFEHAAPGTVLRVRVAPGNATGKIANSSAVYNILYRTTDTRYRPSWAVTTLIVPETLPANSSISDILLSYQLQYDSPDVDASPSYALYGGVSGYVTTALGKGWYVNTPDYEGPTASFTAGVQSGHAVLDSIRAVLSTGFGLAPNTTYGMLGYSGGELASEWAAELQVQYAPELSFAGMAVGDMVPNVTSVIFATTGTITAGIVPLGVVGILNQYPELLCKLNQSLKQTGPYNATTFLGVKNQTLIQATITFANQNLSNYFVNDDFTDFLNSPEAQAVVNSNGIQGYHGVPQMPVYANKRIHDELSPIADSDKLVARYCEVGANIQYLRNDIGGHGATSTQEDEMTFEFLESVFRGSYNHTGCTVMNVSIANPS